jgi:hypothetical protein
VEPIRQAEKIEPIEHVDRNSNAFWQRTITFIVFATVELTTWAMVRAAGIEDAVGVLVFSGVAALCLVYTFGPSKWLEDPEIGGWFGKKHPFATRLICAFGVLVGIFAVCYCLQIVRVPR